MPPPAATLQRLMLRLALSAGCLMVPRAMSSPAPPAEPLLLPPWEVVESPLRPDTRPIRASALLPAEAWSGRAIVTLADAFRHTPGALMQESFGGFEPPRLSIRGSGVQSAPSSRGVALLLDGLPLGLADGSFNAALFDPLIGSRLEVQRGPDGWRIAPATMGGALDLRSAGPAAPGTIAASGRAEAGSFGAFRATTAAGVSQNFGDAAGAVSFARQDGYRQNSKQERTTAHGTVSRALAPDTRATLGLYHAHVRYEVPGPLTLSAALRSPRGISTDAARDLPRRTAAVTRLAGSLGQHSTTHEVDLGVSVARTTDEFHQLQANGVTRSRSDDLGAQASYSQRLDVGSMPHQLRGAATATRGWRRAERFRNEAGRAGAKFADDGLLPTTACLQFEDTVAIGIRGAATAGVGHVTSVRKIAPRDGTAVPTTLRHEATLPQAGVRWNLSRGTTVFATVSRSFEPPVFDDLLAVAGTHPQLTRRIQRLDAQRASTVEAGVRAQAGQLHFDLAVYRATWRGEILRLADDTGAAQGAVNASPTRHTGVETSMRWLLFDRGVRISLAGTAVWTDFRFRNDPVYGQARLAGMPPHVGTAELSIETPRRGFAAFGADWTHGRTRVDHAGRLAYDNRAMAHLRFGFRRSDALTLFVDVRNVFNEGGIASTAGVLDLARNPSATAIFLPRVGRTVSAGVAWKR